MEIIIGFLFVAILIIVYLIFDKLIDIYFRNELSKYSDEYNKNLTYGVSGGYY